MSRQAIMAAVAGLVIGVAGTLGVSAATRDEPSKTGTGSQVTTSATAHIAQAAAKLQDLKGDDFDKAFIDEMIMHHQGAIDMARLIEANARHDELKLLGRDIISTQSKEIDMMQTWQTDWGYKTTPQSHDGTSH